MVQTAETVRSRGTSASVSGRHLFVATLLVGTLIFVLLHLPPLSGHLIVAGIAALASAALVGVAVGQLITRQGTDPPVVVITAPGAADVRTMQSDDLDFCAELHAQALAHGFFVSLGHGFMRAYHRTFLESPHAIELISTARGHPVGFLVAVLRPQSHVRWVLRHRGAGLAFRGAIALAMRPRIAIRFVRDRLRRYLAGWRRHGGRSAEETEDTRFGSAPAVLSHMAVVTGARGTGAGRRLVETFEATAGNAGARWAMLTTLAGSEGAGGFYARLGWSLRGRAIDLNGVPTEQWARELGGER